MKKIAIIGGNDISKTVKSILDIETQGMMKVCK